MPTGISSLIERGRAALIWAARAAWILAAVGIFLMMVIIVYDVLARYVLNRPSEWTFQTTSSGLLAVTFLALPYVYARDEHISVDLIYDHLPRTLRVVAGQLTRVITVVFGLVLVWYGVDLVQSASAAGLRTSGAWNLPVSLVSAPMPIGGALLALVALVTHPPAVDPPENHPIDTKVGAS